MSQTDVLAWLQARGDWGSTAMIAKALGVATRSVSANLSALERAGLVERRVQMVQEEAWQDSGPVLMRHPLHLFRVRRPRGPRHSASKTSSTTTR